MQKQFFELISKNQKILLTKVAKYGFATFVTGIFQNIDYCPRSIGFSDFQTFLGFSVKQNQLLTGILSNSKKVLSNMTVGFDRTADCQGNYPSLTEFL